MPEVPVELVGNIRYSTREVSGSEHTFEQAVESVQIPQPPLMSYKQWLVWRSEAGGPGRAPAKRVDGAPQSNARESRIHQRVMAV